MESSVIAGTSRLTLAMMMASVFLKLRVGRLSTPSSATLNVPGGRTTRGAGGGMVGFGVDVALGVVS
jgi:hypothetical protein